MESPVSSVRRRSLRNASHAGAFVPLLTLFFSACGPTAPPSPPGLAVSPQRPVLTQGDSLRLTATVGGHGVESGSVIHWTSLNSGGATGSSLGTGRALRVRGAVIVAPLHTDAHP